MVRGEDAIIFCPGAAGRGIADRIAGHFGWPLRSGAAGGGEGLSFAEDLRDAFAAGRTIIGVCSSGILIRSLAPVIRDKHSEPPVICVSPDGSSVVPLLGGHHGANRLAAKLANMLSAHLALSTASDARLGCSLDEPPAGWRLENPHHVKAAAAAILAGAPTIVIGSGDWLQPLSGLAHVIFNRGPGDAGQLRIEAGRTPPLLYVKQTLAVGVGCVRGCSGNELRHLVESALSSADLSPSAVAGVYSIDLKSDEAAVHELAGHLGVPARFFPPQILETFADRLTAASELVFKETGAHGVSEAAALAAAGPDGQLIVPKLISGGATCAVARIGSGAPDVGIPRGLLMIIGIGPGGAEWRTAEARRMLGISEDLVGYTGYLDLLGSAAVGRRTFGFDLGQETERCRFALERASQGRRVALISSGDAGIYAMASLVFELMAKGPAPGGVSDAARRVEILCAPGVSAMQMASAKAGAILGHDFCAVSLSDLLTPRDIILQRVEAAADGDFVTAFYNPASRRRQTLLEESRDILLRRRPPNTPVLIAKKLARSGECLSQMPLQDLRAEHADMLTLIIVGNSVTGSFTVGDSRQGVDGSFIYTPRGYSNRETAIGTEACCRRASADEGQPDSGQADEQVSQRPPEDAACR